MGARRPLRPIYFRELNGPVGDGRSTKFTSAPRLLRQLNFGGQRAPQRVIGHVRALWPARESPWMARPEPRGGGGGAALPAAALPFARSGPSSRPPGFPLSSALPFTVLRGGLACFGNVFAVAGAAIPGVVVSGSAQVAGGSAGAPAPSPEPTSLSAEPAPPPARFFMVRGSAVKWAGAVRAGKDERLRQQGEAEEEEEEEDQEEEEEEEEEDEEEAEETEEEELKSAKKGDNEEEGREQRRRARSGEQASASKASPPALLRVPLGLALAVAAIGPFQFVGEDSESRSARQLAGHHRRARALASLSRGVGRLLAAAVGAARGRPPAEPQPPPPLPPEPDWAPSEVKKRSDENKKLVLTRPPPASHRSELRAPSPRADPCLHSPRPTAGHAGGIGPAGAVPAVVPLQGRPSAPGGHHQRHARAGEADHAPRGGLGAGPPRRARGRGALGGARARAGRPAAARRWARRGAA